MIQIEDVAIFGAGGVGGYLIQLLNKMKIDITLIDGDRVETKNLERQMFEKSDVDEYKVDCFSVYSSIPQFIDETNPMDKVFKQMELIFIAVDNNYARQIILNQCDKFNVPVIGCANEVDESEAWIYFPEWKGTNKDPRIYYPDILKETVNPLTVSCTEKAETKGLEQTTFANSLAANFGIHLLQMYFDKGLTLDDKNILPILERSSWSCLASSQAVE